MARIQTVTIKRDLLVEAPEDKVNSDAAIIRHRLANQGFAMREKDIIKVWKIYSVGARNTNWAIVPPDDDWLLEIFERYTTLER